MPAIREKLLDAWAAMTYKPAFRNASTDSRPPTWVPEDDERRLRAYMLLDSYRNNVSRLWLDNPIAERDRREYGDVETIVETLVASILGEDVNISVDGAGQEGEAVDPQADALAEWFEQWEEDERPLLTIIEAEDDAVTFGDGVYEVAYDATKGRPRITCYDPGSYFPVLNPAEHEDYPERVHIAWQYETKGPTGEISQWVRRITWELVSVYFDHDLGEFVEVNQDLPWNDGPVQVTCVKSDGTWAWDELAERTVTDFSPDSARWAVNADGVPVRNLDLGIDYIPVVHLPNTPNRKGHFGKSSLVTVMQLLDDLQYADTDLALASRLVGSPPLSVEGDLVTSNSNGEAGTKVRSYGPGMVISGKATYVDASRNLDALLKEKDALEARLSANTRLSETVLGKVSPADVPSGFALELSFGPMKSLIRKMRLVRDEKYSLLFKFVARFAMLAGDLEESTDLPKVTLEFGSFLPTDRAGIIKDVISLFKEKLISRPTAVKILVNDAGLDIEDVEAELKAIAKEDFTGAKALADATGRDEDAQEYLGLGLGGAAAPEAPQPELPELPGSAPVVTEE